MNAPPSLADQERLRQWRAAIAECLAIARGYAEIVELAAAIGDDVVLKYGMANFLEAAKTAHSIFVEDRPIPQHPAATEFDNARIGDGLRSGAGA